MMFTTGSTNINLTATSNNTNMQHQVWFGAKVESVECLLHNQVGLVLQTGQSHHPFCLSAEDAIKLGERLIYLGRSQVAQQVLDEISGDGVENNK